MRMQFAQVLKALGILGVIFFTFSIALNSRAQDTSPTQTVDVQLTEFKIEMSTTLEPGLTRFNVKNSGNMLHNIEIEGQGIEKVLEEDLLPGQSGSLTVDLQSGEYYVYCPVGNHEARGMALTLTVEGAEETPSGETAAPHEHEHEEMAEEPTMPVLDVEGDPTEGEARLAEVPVEETEHRHESAHATHTPPRPRDLGTATGLKKFVYWLGKFHPPMVNFPIALIVAAALAELLYMGTRNSIFDHASRFCTWLGVLGAIAAGVLGWFFAGFRLTDHMWLMTWHRWLGTTAVVWALITLILSEKSRPPQAGGLRRWFRFFLFIAAIVVLIVGFFGGAMIYGLDHYQWP